MQRTVFTDKFFYNQPPLSFIEDLKKSLHDKKPDFYGKRDKESCEIDVSGLFINSFFEDDPDNLLQTIYDDFNRFLNIYNINNGKNTFPLNLKKCETECFEAYSIEITQNEINICSNDTEGIRRGIIYLEDMLRISEAPFLKKEKIFRTPKIKSRITRCFFSPINRPPKFGDELSDDIDYYPDEYLNRIMHDGSNGVWIYTRFSDILPSSIIPEYGKGYEKRIKKLNRTIEKCRRYGIGVYVFAIEPVALPPELAAKYPDMVSGTAYNGNRYFCCSSERGKAYCYEAGKKLVELCPGLRGFISITYGERPTSCSSQTYGATITDGAKIFSTCPRCGKKKTGEILSLPLKALRSGMKEANKDFEVIAWSYAMRYADREDMLNYIEQAPEDVMLMLNFEDSGAEEQLGKIRLCEDYWLSYAGPSQMFTSAAQKAEECKKHLFAKMQVCVSHEIATVPYVPVPGLIFDKYKSARGLGVEGVMQCWYFGNYPSFMSKAAGELSFETEFSDKDAFLERLAGIYWGKTKAKAVAKAWKLFEEGYKNYPMNIMFSYYGPMHDGVCWDLSLKPKNFPLARTWQAVDPTDGDRIYDALVTVHTLEEAMILCKKMHAKWHEGMDILSSLDVQSDDEKEQVCVSKAIDILFDSGNNILKFYYLRDVLGKQEGDCYKILAEMENLCHAEIKNSENMIPLCKQCNSLGYHSECEGFKFFPEKLEYRIKNLKTLLETEFTEVKQRLDSALSPLEYYDGVEEGFKRYEMNQNGIENAKWENISKNSFFKMAYDENNLYISLKGERGTLFEFAPEYNLMKVEMCVQIDENGMLPINMHEYRFFQIFGERAKQEKEKYRNIEIIKTEKDFCANIVIDLKQIGVQKIRPMKIRFVADGEVWCPEAEREYTEETYPQSTLGKTRIIPPEYGWIIPV